MPSGLETVDDGEASSTPKIRTDVELPAQLGKLKEEEDGGDDAKCGARDGRATLPLPQKSFDNNCTRTVDISTQQKMDCILDLRSKDGANTENHWPEKSVRIAADENLPKVSHKEHSPEKSTPRSNTASTHSNSEDEEWQWLPRLTASPSLPRSGHGRRASQPKYEANPRRTAKAAPRNLRQ